MKSIFVVTLVSLTLFFFPVMAEKVLNVLIENDTGRLLIEAVTIDADEFRSSFTSLLEGNYSKSLPKELINNLSLIPYSVARSLTMDNICNYFLNNPEVKVLPEFLEGDLAHCLSTVLDPLSDQLPGVDSIRVYMRGFDRLAKALGERSFTLEGSAASLPIKFEVWGLFRDINPRLLLHVTNSDYNPAVERQRELIVGYRAGKYSVEELTWKKSFSDSYMLDQAVVMLEAYRMEELNTRFKKLVTSNPRPTMELQKLLTERMHSQMFLSSCKKSVNKEAQVKSLNKFLNKLVGSRPQVESLVIHGHQFDGLTLHDIRVDRSDIQIFLLNDSHRSEHQGVYRILEFIAMMQQ